MKKRKNTEDTKKEKPPKKAKIALVAADELEQLSLAIRACVEAKKPSTSLIQRTLKIGYARAASLLDRMEELAVVTPARGTEPRKLTGYVPELKVKPVVVEKQKPAADKEKKDVGRPTKYTEKIGQEICERIAMGESVLQICRHDEKMPVARTVYLWLLREDMAAFKKLYEAAREIQAEVFYDELNDIADDGSNDWYDKQVGEDGFTIRVFDHEHVQRSKLRVDTRKWMLARMNAKKYGDKLDIDHSNKGKPFKEPKGAVIHYHVPKAPAKA